MLAGFHKPEHAVITSLKEPAMRRDDPAGLILVVEDNRNLPR
jgi:hypothetical protein